MLTDSYVVLRLHVIVRILSWLLVIGFPSSAFLLVPQKGVRDQRSSNNRPTPIARHCTLPSAMQTFVAEPVASCSYDPVSPCSGRCAHSPLHCRKRCAGRSIRCNRYIVQQCLCFVSCKACRHKSTSGYLTDAAAAGQGPNDFWYRLKQSPRAQALSPQKQRPKAQAPSLRNKKQTSSPVEISARFARLSWTYCWQGAAQFS